MFDEIVNKIIVATVHMLGFTVIVILWIGFGMGLYYGVKYLTCLI